MRVVIGVELDQGGKTGRVLWVKTLQDAPGDTIAPPEGVAVGQNAILPPGADGGPLPGNGAERAYQALTALGMKGARALVRDYRPERILEVCRAAEVNKMRLKNLAGYVRTALRRGWQVL